MMRRLLALALVCAVLPPGVAHAGSIGIGAFGGMSYPVLQNDTGNGKLYGFCAPVKLVPMVTVEPFYASSTLSDKVTTIAGLSYSRQGFDITAYGVNAMLATGGPVSFYPIVGIGQTRLKRDQFDQSFTTYNLGLGLGLSPMPKVTVNLRGQLQAVVDGSTSRKFGNATLGASYALFGMP
jgi:opacity protein-like surface antigen